MNEQPIIACKICGLLLEIGTGDCPECGSRDRAISVQLKLRFVESKSKVQKRNGPAGSIRPFEEIREELRWSADRERLERRVMVIDRANDHCEQTWYDLTTGEVAFTKEGALSDPGTHGVSARRGKQSGSR